MTNNAGLNERLAFMQLDAAAQADIRGVKDIVRARLPGILDGFYDQVRATPQTRSFFPDETLLGSARTRQLRHWDGISDGRFDGAYVDAVTRVGEIHARIGLEPRWYIGGYALVLGGLVEAVLQARLPQRKREDRMLTTRVAAELSALVKATLLDMDFAISVYLEAAERNRVEAERRVLGEERERVQHALGEALAALSQGDLTRRVTDDIPVEYHGLRDAYNAAAATLGEALAAVSASTGELARGSNEIARASDDLSKRTEQQAASLEETAAALDQITQTVRRTAEGAKQAADAATKARSEAEQSGEVMRDAVGAMTEIESSSSQIGQIIGVIDEIAFQTNLLALNAGVEAARAGDAGKGFAVVASEVRALAQRSAEAAKEIKSLISTSSAQVNRGAKLVGDTGKALSAIVEAIANIDALVGEIAASTHEQATGMGEVNTAVNQMDQITQQNAAMVEQATAAAAGLRSEAASLSSLVSRFEISADGQAAPKYSRAVAPAPAPVRDDNPVHAARARLAAFGRSGAAVAVKPAGDWEEF
jgi:methyl-accepting chemotaxis protein